MGIPIKNARIRKISTGSSPTYGITIPPSYIKNGMLAEGQMVDVDLTPAIEEAPQIQMATTRQSAKFFRKADKDRSSDPGNAGVEQPGQSHTEVWTLPDGSQHEVVICIEGGCNQYNHS